MVLRDTATRKGAQEVQQVHADAAGMHELDVPDVAQAAAAAASAALNRLRIQAELTDDYPRAEP